MLISAALGMAWTWLRERSAWIIPLLALAAVVASLTGLGMALSGYSSIVQKARDAYWLTELEKARQKGEQDALQKQDAADRAAEAERQKGETDEAIRARAVRLEKQIMAIDKLQDKLPPDLIRELNQ